MKKPKCFSHFKREDDSCISHSEVKKTNWVEFALQFIVGLFRGDIFKMASVLYHETVPEYTVMQIQSSFFLNLRTAKICSF